jgi:hypothetical protein
MDISFMCISNLTGGRGSCLKLNLNMSDLKEFKQHLKEANCPTLRQKWFLKATHSLIFLVEPFICSIMKISHQEAGGDTLFSQVMRILP